MQCPRNSFCIIQYMEHSSCTKLGHGCHHLNIHRVNYDSLLTVEIYYLEVKKYGQPYTLNTPLIACINKPPTGYIGLRLYVMVKCLQIFQDILDALY